MTSLMNDPYLCVSPVCRQVDGQGHDFQVDLFLAGVQDHPHDDGDAVGVGKHALHFVLQAQVVQHATHRVLQQTDKKICKNSLSGHF